MLGQLQAEGYGLGVISNHDDGLLKVLKLHRLDQMFETVTYSHEVGAEKPSGKVFHRAMERAHCSPSAALHVGNSLSADVEGARQSGLEAIWINRDDQPVPAGIPSIRTLRELPSLVERLNRARSA